MELCITSTGPSLESEVDPRFGRCRFFILVNPLTMEFEACENNAAGASGGAGVQSAKYVADRGVKTVLTGNVGPKAFDTLNAAGLDIVTGAVGVTVREAVNNFLEGSYNPVSSATVAEHSGMRK